MRATKEIVEWYEKELRADDLDEFVEFAESQGWSETISGNVMIISNNGRKLYFEIKTKWVRIHRSAFPLVRAFYFARGDTE